MDEAIQLMAHHAKNAVRDLGHFQPLSGTMFPGELGHRPDTCWQDVTELMKDTADHVYDLSAFATIAMYFF